MPYTPGQPFLVAAVQISPAFLDRDATVDRACQAIAGASLTAYETALGPLAGLICWENYMPLARQALYESSVHLYIAPTWDRGEPWLSTLRHIAKEGRVYVIGCCSAMRPADLPDRFAFKAMVPVSTNGWINPGDSVVIDPDGKVVAGPLNEKQDLLYAEVDPQRIVGPRWQLDVAGHYARPDVLGLVRRGRALQPPVSITPTNDRCT